MAMVINHSLISGTVCDDPQIVGEGEGKWAFLKIMTHYGQRMPDGSYIDVEQPIQIVADVPHHVTTIEKYVKKGKAMSIYGYIKTWQVSGVTHTGVFIRSITFATPNWGSDSNNGTPAPPQ